MADKQQDFGPLPSSIARALSDRLYEKRKGAALEIEKLVRDLAQNKNFDDVEKIIKVLSKEFVSSSNPNAKRGGVIGLAATAIGLGKDSRVPLQTLLNPVLSAFKDPDSRTRYSACEALYNIVKMTRNTILQHLNEIIDILGRLVIDPDLNVRNGVEPLDKLMKDIVAETQSFDVESFIVFLRNNIYAKRSVSRQFILSWITTLDSLPDIDLIVFLPELLDGLFTVLGDPAPDVKKMCDFCLENFLQQIRKNPSKVEFCKMINILIEHSKSQDPQIQLTALKWMAEFLNLAGRQLLPYTAGIMGQALPCLSDKGVGKNDIREVAKSVNSRLMDLITRDDDIKVRSDREGETRSKGKSSKEGLVVNLNETGKEELASSQLPTETTGLAISSMVTVFKHYIIHREMGTKIAVLEWMKHLLEKTPKLIFQHMDDIFPELLKTVCDQTDEVVLFDLELLSMIVQSEAGPADVSNSPPRPGKPQQNGPEAAEHGMNIYFTQCMNNLMETFANKPDLLKHKGSFIIRQLCLFLNAEHIYRSLSEILLESHELRFATEMVQILNQILLTSSELFELRNQLKDLATERSASLFCCLYKTWCHSPVATVSLCLLSQCHQHASLLISKFGNLEVTVDFLTEIDKLVQLLESPIFTYLRLQLLEADQNPYLVKSLYGILMLLPQSKTFEILHKRLACVPNLPSVPTKDSKNSPKGDKRPHVKSINWTELSDHFDVIQVKHFKLKRMRQRAMEERKKNWGLNTR